jgi:hypothetical protein
MIRCRCLNKNRGLLLGQPSPLNLTPDEWMSVLKLSTIWDFAVIRATAIKTLEMYGKEDPVSRIIVAKKYDIPEWFVPVVNALAKRSETLKEEEMMRLLDLGSM